MNQNSRRRLSVFILKREDPSKVLRKNTAYPKQAFLFGLRWLLRKFNICANAYYNYLKNRKADYHQKKDEIKNSIREIYHSHGGVDGYRTVHAYPVRKGYDISRLTVHKYMNTEMQLFSISRKKKPAYEHVIAHKVYEDKLK